MPAVIVFILMSIFTIILSLILLNKNSISGIINPYNRDATSGTREAFEKAIDFDPDLDRYSNNVNEVSSNDQMSDRIKTDKNGFGYLSYETIKNNYDDYNVLTFNGVPLNEETIINLEYDAVRPFNLFFRVPSTIKNDYDLNEIYLFLFDNLYINSFEVKGFGTEKNIWDDGYSTTLTLNLSNEFIISWAFYNWILYSNEAQGNIIGLGFNKTKDKYNGIEMLNDYLKNFSLIGFGDEIFIETMGSTSVISTLNKLFYDEEYGFSKLLFDNFNLKISYNGGNHTGSGSAFKLNDEVFLGFQSRGMKWTEIIDDWIPETWTENDVINDDGFYESYLLDSLNYIPYSTFEYDAIGFVMNKNLKFNYNGKKYEILGINSIGTKFIYTYEFPTLEALYLNNNLIVEEII